MTMTIAQAFDRFGRDIMPDGGRLKRAENIQRHLRSQLEHHLDGLRGSFITGSLARSTAVKPLGDVDVFVELDPGKYTRSMSPKEALRALQKALKSTLGSSATLRLQNHSIGVEGNHDIRLDLVPAIPLANGDYAIPDLERGQWILSNPRLHKKRLDEADQRAGSKARPLIRMAKVARRLHFKKMGSYHLEAMACRVLTTAPKSFDVGVRDLLAGLEAVVMERIPDLAGGPAIHLDLGERQGFQRGITVAKDAAIRALAYAEAGRIEKAHAQWRHVFGQTWPAR